MNPKEMEWLKSVCSIYSAGEQIYQTLAGAIGDKPGTEAVVSPANLGDTVFIASLAKAYKAQYGINSLIMVAKERQAAAVEWMEGIDAVVGLTDEEIIALRYFFVISGKFYENGVRYGHIPCYITPEYPDVFFHVEPGFGGKSLMRVWEEDILQIPAGSPIGDIVIPPGISAPAENAQKYANAVLIAPAAFTNKGIPKSFWEKLTVRLKEKGYEVYNNSGGLYYDDIIDGTKEFLSSTTDLILNAPLFKRVISVRSGFTDLVCRTTAELTVLHLGGDIDAPLEVEYGSRFDDVRDFGRMEGIYPYVYVSEREDELIDLISNF
ncbi:MAG: hypothetical protein K5840_04040 [Eubacterium sp.]|nr:hypothetical protein [Eubacterium sp.]